jgi:hypothetical protein
MNDMKPLTFFLVIISVLAVWSFASGMDYQDEVQEQSTYCEMVAIWKAEIAEGVTHENRTGWPPYKGEEMCK